MAVTRPLKEGSVTTYQQKVALGFPDILASEMDADLDTIYAAWNGGITSANILPSSVRGTPSSGGTAREIAKASIWAGDDLIDLSIPTAKLADGAVTWAKRGGLAHAYVYRAATLPQLANGANVTLTFDSVVDNVGGLYNTGANDRFTIAAQGFYVFGGTVLFDTSTGGTRRILHTSVDGNLTGSSEAPQGAQRFVMATLGQWLNAAQVVQLKAYQDSGSVLGTLTPLSFWIARVS